mmetsp:Transcript_99047/g.279855  ORF Transcript_99047/g.279855 Transcript_99047/m.279855 type:complete len:169 (-) Transcript_99047:347-853(-)
MLLLVVLLRFDRSGDEQESTPCPVRLALDKLRGAADRRGADAVAFEENPARSKCKLIEDGRGGALKRSAVGMEGCTSAWTVPMQAPPLLLLMLLLILLLLLLLLLPSVHAGRAAKGNAGCSGGATIKISEAAAGSLIFGGVTPSDVSPATSQVATNAGDAISCDPESA